MTCIECNNADLQANPNYSKVGFSACKKLNLLSGVFQSLTYRRQCADFDQADSETINKRRIWLAKQSIK